MGHDIVLKVRGDVVARFYISGNWSNHNPSIHDLHGHQGYVIIPFLKEKLKEMVEKSIFPRTNLNVDVYGCYKDDLEAFYDGANERIRGREEAPMKYFDAWQDYREGVKKTVFAIDCMHAFIMSEALLLALRYPHAYWYSDQVFAIRELNGDKGMKDVEENDSSDDY